MTSIRPRTIDRTWPSPAPFQLQRKNISQGLIDMMPAMAATAPRLPDAAVIRCVSADRVVNDAMTARMHPGLVMVTTDLPAHPETRSGKDVVIATQTS